MAQVMAIVQEQQMRQIFAPDEFFTAEQQSRLKTLMTHFHAGILSPIEQSELEQLIEAEWQAAIHRTSFISPLLCEVQ